jgi:hypothetical protein
LSPLWKRFATTFSESLPDDHGAIRSLFCAGHLLTIQKPHRIVENAAQPFEELLHPTEGSEHLPVEYAAYTI